MPMIAIAHSRRMADYVESVKRAGGEPVEVMAGVEKPEHILALFVEDLRAVVEGVELLCQAEAELGQHGKLEAADDLFDDVVEP